MLGCWDRRRRLPRGVAAVHSAFLWFVAHARSRTMIIYTVLTALLIIALPALIHIDLPVGLLASLG